MKPSAYFILGFLLAILLFLPALYFSALLEDFFRSSGVAVFYQIIQFATTITCTKIILDKIHKSKED